MTVVVDSNILIAFGLADEPLYTQANRILSTWQTTEEQLTAPRLFRSEMTAVIRKVVYQERMTPEQGRAMLAQRLNCDFWTAGERVVNSTRGQFSHIRWLGDWNATS